MAEILSIEQISFYKENGYLVLEDQIPEKIIRDIRSEIARFEEIAQSMSVSDDILDLEDSHTKNDPRLRRIKWPHLHSKVMHDLMYSDHILGPARDLVGPNIRMHTTKLNMKKAGYGAAVEWHQDYAFYPHTNDDILAVGVVIDDIGHENGPLMVVPGSHRGPVFDHHVDGVFAGAFLPEAVGLDLSKAVELTCKASAITIHHGRIAHGSALNRSDRARRLLFYEMMAADAFPIMGSMTNWDGIEDYDARMLCGTPTITPRLKDIPIRIPQPQPKLDTVVSIYEIQKKLGNRAFDTIPSKESENDET